VPVPHHQRPHARRSGPCLIGVQIAGLVLLVSIRFETIVTFDTVLIVSILGFVSTLAFAQFIGRRGAAQ